MGRISCSKKEIAYYLYFSVMLFAKGVGWYDGMAIYNFCLIFSTGVLLLKIAMDTYSVQEAACMAALVLLGFIVWQKSGEKGPFLYILLLIGMKNIPVKRVFRLGFAVWSVAFIMQVLLALVGIRTGTVMAHKKLGLGHILRWSMGYSHPNVYHISFVILIAFLLYTFRLEGKRLVQATILCFIGNLYIFLYSVSYTGFLFASVYLIVNLYLNLRKRRTKAEDIMLYSLFPCCVLFSAAGPLILRGKLFELCDKALNSRFSLSRRYMLEGTWSLFGSRQMQIREQSLNYTLDCSYTYLLMYGGLIIFAVMCIGYLGLIHCYIKKNKNKELAIIFGLMIAGISEPFLFNTAYKNLSMIFMGSFFFEILEKYNRTDFQIHLIKTSDKEIDLSVCNSLAGTAGQLRDFISRKKILLAGIGIAAALAAGGLYATFAERPDSIYILKQGSDRYEEIVYLDIDNLPENFRSRIISYKDPQTPMYKFQGNMLTLEYARGIISSGLFAGFFVPGLYSAAAYLAARKIK